MRTVALVAVVAAAVVVAATTTTTTTSPTTVAHAQGLGNPNLPWGTYCAKGDWGQASFTFTDDQMGFDSNGVTYQYVLYYKDEWGYPNTLSYAGDSSMFSMDTRGYIHDDYTHDHRFEYIGVQYIINHDAIRIRTKEPTKGQWIDIPRVKGTATSTPDCDFSNTFRDMYY